jgi:hypothetical protein
MRCKLTLVGGAVLIAAMATVLPASAHHAHGNYSLETTDFEGVVTEVHALNPHSWIYISRRDASGKEQLWALEGGGPGGLRKLESEGKGLKVGDKVKVRCHPLRDGSPGCLLGFMKHPDGVTYDHDSGTRPVTLEGF